MNTFPEYAEEFQEWVIECLESITDESPVISPSEWAETRRYLSKSTTSMPGMYSFEVAPYLEEIVNNFSVRSPVRFVSVMKGVQLCMTVGVLENIIGYNIDHVKSAPCMLVTADAELATLRLNKHIKPMIRDSDLQDRIASSDEGNSRKTGSTDSLLEWVGGGFLYPLGAKNADKLRSIPIQVLLRDEISSFPLKVGKDGDPLKLSEDRTAAFEASRKILDISTPLELGTCQIHAEYLKGDQRKYYVPCRKCGEKQVLKFHGVNKETGHVYGLVYETLPNGNLDHESVRYACEFCGHQHLNEDKLYMLKHGEWRATADPVEQNRRSYHVSALYSPVGMQHWATLVQKWFDAWDVKNNKVRDVQKLQVFYNNVLGEPFQVKGDRLEFKRVSKHKRSEYRLGEINNNYITSVAKSHVLFLTMTVDVQTSGDLQVAIYGFTIGLRAFLIDHQVFKGDVKDINNPETWGKVTEMLTKDYKANDGKVYRPAICLVDSGDGKMTSRVYQWCKKNPTLTFPIKGVGGQRKDARTIIDFTRFKTKVGTDGYSIYVDMYKDNLISTLEFNWDGIGEQPERHYNVPYNLSDKVLKELTAEEKRAVMQGSKIIGYEYYRGGRDNELLDLTVYANAAADILVNRFFTLLLKKSDVDWNLFYKFCIMRRLFYRVNI